MQNLKQEKAMRKELQALSKNNTSSIVPLPRGKKVIGSKQVYKIKYKPDRSIEPFKTWWVAKRYNQIHGLDYNETFTPLAKFCNN